VWVLLWWVVGCVGGAGVGRLCVGVGVVVLMQGGVGVGGGGGKWVVSSLYPAPTTFYVSFKCILHVVQLLARTIIPIDTPCDDPIVILYMIRSNSDIHF